MSAPANDPGAASGVLASPSCGVPSGTPRRSSLRFPLSLPGSFASLAMVTRTDSQARLALERRAGKTREPMRLEARGHPLHTRALSVVLAARADGRLDVHGTVLDLRKRGFVPVAGDLQGAGVIHDMRLAGKIDPGSATLETLAAEQRSVAFEASAVTGGESCRDPIDRIAALAGTRLDDGWARRLGDAIGGPRGCSHLLPLGHLLGSSAAGAPRTWRGRRGARTARPSRGWSGAGSAAASPPSCSPAWAGHPTTAPSSTPSSCWRPRSCSARRRCRRHGRSPSAPTRPWSPWGASPTPATCGGGTARSTGRARPKATERPGDPDKRAPGGLARDSGAPHRRAFLRAPPKAFDSRAPERPRGPPAPARKAR